MSAHEDLDSDHRRPAVGADVSRLPGLDHGGVGIGCVTRVRWYLQQFPGLCQVVAASGVGDQTVVADAVKARWAAHAAGSGA